MRVGRHQQRIITPRVAPTGGRLVNASIAIVAVIAVVVGVVVVPAATAVIPPVVVAGVVGAPVPAVTIPAVVVAVIAAAGDGGAQQGEHAEEGERSLHGMSL